MFEAYSKDNVMFEAYSKDSVMFEAYFTTCTIS